MVTPTDLYAFGSARAPRPPRAEQDFLLPGEDAQVPAGVLPFPMGASVFADPGVAPLTGHYHRLAAGSELPPELAVAADGPDAQPGSTYEPTHHTIYPVRAMPFVAFRELFMALPWAHARKR